MKTSGTIEEILQAFSDRLTKLESEKVALIGSLQVMRHLMIKNGVASLDEINDQLTDLQNSFKSIPGANFETDPSLKAIVALVEMLKVGAAPITDLPKLSVIKGGVD